MPPPDYSPIFDSAGKEWNVDPTLLRAVMGHESGGDKTAVSPKGAQGLMQIMPPTGRDLGVTDPNDPAQSIYGGAKYLRQMLDQFKRPALALAAYNAGPNRIADWIGGKATLPDETLKYVPAVTARYSQLRGNGPQTGGDTVATAPSKLPNVDDFLKMTGATPAPAPAGAIPAAADTAKLPSIDDFLKMTGGNIPTDTQPITDIIRTPNAAKTSAQITDWLAKTAPPMPEPAPYIGPYNDTSDSPSPLRPPSTPAPQPGLLSRVGNALVSPFTEGGQLGPDTSGPFYNGVMGPVNKLVVAGPLSVLDAAGRLVEGAARGIGTLAGAGYEGAGGAQGQAARLTRDIAQMPAALMPLTIGADAAALQGVRNAGMPDIAANRLAANTNIANRLDEAIANDVRGPARAPYLLNKLTDAIKAADEPVPNALTGLPDSGPIAGMGDRRAVGAAGTPDALAAIPPREAAAARGTAEVEKLTEAQPPGAYTGSIPGVNLTEAQMVQKADVARREKLLESQMPEPFKEAARANSDARLNYFKDIAGTDTLKNTLMQARGATAEKDLTAAFSNKQPTDISPVLDVASQILNSPDGRRPIVRTAVGSVINELKGADGKPLTDPEMLYGVRKHIDDLMSKEAARDTPAAVRAQSQLQQIKTALDGTIEQGAPGFRQYLQNFAAASKPIDEMDVLQKYVAPGKVLDSQNRMTYSGVQRMMKDIVAARRAPGINPEKSISDETMNKLWALRDDLRAVASTEDLAKARGSDTFQNLYDAGKSLAASGAKNALRAGVGVATAGLGNAPLELMFNKLAQRNVEKGVTRALNPPRNPLVQPPLE